MSSNELCAMGGSGGIAIGSEKRIMNEELYRRGMTCDNSRAVATEARAPASPLHSASAKPDITGTDASTDIPAHSKKHASLRLAEEEPPNFMRRKEDSSKFALIVGIENYRDLPPAEFAARDAGAIRAYLHAMGYPARQIIYLENEKATKTGIQKYLEEWLPRNTTRNSSVFIYYSGHGAPDVTANEAFLVPWDGDIKFLQTTAYSLKQFYRSIANLKVKNKVVVLDSCFSGAGGRSVVARGTRPLVNKLDLDSALPAKMTVFAAAAADEITSTLDEEGHGIFTFYFLKGLGGAAADNRGAVTVGGLYDYIRAKVADAARLQNREQTPILLGERRSEVLLAP